MSMGPMPRLHSVPTPPPPLDKKAQDVVECSINSSPHTHYKYSCFTVIVLAALVLLAWHSRWVKEPINQTVFKYHSSTTKSSQSSLYMQSGRKELKQDHSLACRDSIHLEHVDLSASFSLGCVYCFPTNTKFVSGLFLLTASSLEKQHWSFRYLYFPGHVITSPYVKLYCISAFWSGDSKRQHNHKLRDQIDGIVLGSPLPSWFSGNRREEGTSNKLWVFGTWQKRPGLGAIQIVFQ